MSDGSSFHSLGAADEKDPIMVTFWSLVEIHV